MIKCNFTVNVMYTLLAENMFVNNVTISCFLTVLICPALMYFVMKLFNKQGAT